MRSAGLSPNTTLNLGVVSRLDARGQSTCRHSPQNRVKAAKLLVCSFFSFNPGPYHRKGRGRAITLSRRPV